MLAHNRRRDVFGSRAEWDGRPSAHGGGPQQRFTRGRSRSGGSGPPGVTHQRNAAVPGISPPGKRRGGLGTGARGQRRTAPCAPGAAPGNPPGPAWGCAAVPVQPWVRGLRMCLRVPCFVRFRGDVGGWRGGHKGLSSWCVRVYPSPPLCPNEGQVLVQGAKVQEHRVAVFGQARVTMRHGTHVADISQPSPSKHDNPKQQARTPPTTQEHMALQPHQHCATHIDPPGGLRKARNQKSKKDPNVRKTGSPCLDNGRGGGGGQRFEFSGVNYFVPYIVPSHCGLGRGRGTGEKQVIKKKTRH